MNLEEKEVLLELKYSVIAALSKADEDILKFAPSGDGKHFDFLIRKAIEYRTILEKIELKLRKI